MSFGKTFVLVGLVLIIVTWLLGSGMPEAAARNFDKLVAARGGSNHPPPSRIFRRSTGRWDSLAACSKTLYLA